jgi:hypothetical protein
MSSSEGRDKLEYKILRNQTVYKGWRNIVQRDIVLPSGKLSTYDVVSQDHPSVGVFVWNSTSSTTTLVREYHPGVGESLYGVVGGMFEARKHSSSLECAKFELEEEMQLSSDHWIPLLESSNGSNSTSISFDKYSDNVLYPFLALDCKTVENPRSPDDDEFIFVENDVSYRRLNELISMGKMNIFSSYLTLLALRKLEEMKIPIDKEKY